MKPDQIIVRPMTTARKLKLTPTNITFARFTGAAVVITLFYLLVCAQPIYKTQIQLIIKENKDPMEALVTGIPAGLFGSSGHTSVEDAYVLTGYLQSSQFIELAEQRLGLKAHYSSPSFDPLHSLKRNPRAEDFYDYIRKQIAIQIDPNSNIVSIEVSAFSPEKALALANLLVEESEKAINNLNTRMATSQTSLALQELAQTQATLLEKRQQLLKFQTDNSIVNPTSEVHSRLTNVAGLDAHLIEKETTLRAKLQYMQGDSFEVKSLRQEIRALDEQRQSETGNLIASGDKSMAAILIKYEDIKMQADFALQAYSSAFTLVETAKVEADRQKKFLLLIAPAHLPEKPAFPSLPSNTLTAFAIASVAFGIVRLTAATIRDHSI